MSPKGILLEERGEAVHMSLGCEAKTKLMLTGSKLRYLSPQGHPCGLQTDSTLSLGPRQWPLVDRIPPSTPRDLACPHLGLRILAR